LYIFLVVGGNSFTTLRVKEKNKHRGEILQAVVHKSSISISQLAKRLGISRGTYYNHIQDNELPFEIIEKYGRVLKYDFTNDFPNMHKYVVEEPLENYGPPKNLKEAILQITFYKEKYFILLEKYNKLIEEKIQRNSSL